MRYAVSILTRMIAKFIIGRQRIQIELVDCHHPYVADYLVIRWDGQEVFRDHILPRPSKHGFADPKTNGLPFQVDIDQGNIDGFRHRFQMPPKPMPEDGKGAHSFREINSKTISVICLDLIECQGPTIEAEIYGSREKAELNPNNGPDRRRATRSSTSTKTEYEQFLIGTGVWYVRTRSK
jgi:hypothetical protein